LIASWLPGEWVDARVSYIAVIRRITDVYALPRVFLWYWVSYYCIYRVAQKSKPLSWIIIKSH